MRADNRGKICNSFAKNFELVNFQNSSHFYHRIHFAENLDTYFSEDDVIRAISKLKNKSTPDPDNLCAFFIKICAFFIFKPLVTLINQSIRNGIIPFIWEKTFITPVFKAENSQDLSNYRRISIMGSISKVLETIMSEKITDKVIQHIINEQHGFVKGRSTITILIIFNYL